MKVCLKSFFGILFVAVLFVGCSDKKEANKSNFKVAIQKELDNRCYTANYVFTLPNEIENTSNDKIYYDSLEKINFVKSTQVKLNKSLYFSSPNSGPVDGTKYEITNLGQEYFKEVNKSYNGNTNYILCFGKYNVKSVEKLTEPTAFFGKIVSEAEYIYEIYDIPSWSETLLEEESFNRIKSSISDKNQKSTFNLFLTNDGWEVAK